MDLEELRAFLAIVQTGSFLAASAELGVSRSMLRRRVDALEARVGARLVERTPKGVVTTDAGMLLATQGRRLVQSSSALLHAVREAAGEPVGELRMILPVGLPPHAIVPVLALLRSALPRVAVHLSFGAPTSAASPGDVDVAVSFGDAAGVDAGMGEAWIPHELMRMPVRLLAHPDYLRHHGTPATAEALREHVLLSWAGAGLDPHRWPRRDGTTIAVAPRIVADDAHVLRQAALGRLGIALVPDAALSVPADAGTLVPVLEGVVGCEVVLRLWVPVLLAGSAKIGRIVAMAQGLAGRL